ncbi:hypothetical protein GGQ22_04760 [Nocardioides sp. zg-579]|uniref:GH16 domain-containing protein n=1 Tax=Nocardioides marmotae TaxID=2663857 RepID=A0A6I3IZ73_9ACTN|nr:hypothetical protein [Nocardioides marmotae]MCR6030753.1 hypothetical protein [Gordonia jinghuaiqii]MTB94387.1 hypothetical protein [Nocardioides marmotae]QKE01587.1 hypothetical protein HPC71_11235 [Nocardioides marmotae]
MTSRVLLAVATVVGLLVLPLTASTTLRTVAAAPGARQASLTVTPPIYVPGQAVRFRGTLGKAGRRTVHLQSHMNRPGDTWLDVPSSTFRTAGDGSFDFTFTAPSMSGISYRVAGGGVATRGERFDARPQEITLTLQGADGASPFHAIAPLLPFTVLADTTPPVRSALGTPPPIPGRTVLLQERHDGNRWRTIQRGTTDSAGHATFRVAAPVLGERVLRARQERWTRGGSAIGWYASFPAYFSVLGLGGLLPRATAAATPRTAAPSRSEARPTAGERYRWGPTLFDFAWERGQDLTSPPSKGTRPRGTWLDTSDGTGRATPFNGGLVLQSKLKHGGAGDRGTTTATMRGNARSTGRWEFRLQGHAWEGGPAPFRFRLDLVPEGTPVTGCPTEAVVVADVTVGEPGLAVGVRSQRAGSQWTRRLPGLRLAEKPFNLAVEVAAKHTTWFIDGRPVATVTGARAHLGRRLVPRYSLVGADREMNGAQVDSDWQRGWSLARGRQVTSGAALTRTAYAAC